MSYKSLSERVRLEVKAKKTKKLNSSELDSSNLNGLCVRSKKDGKTWTVVAIIQKDNEQFFKMTAPGLPDSDGNPGPIEKLTISKKDLKGKYDLA